MFPPKKILLLLATTFPLAAQIPAFPGAEGYGAYATGGRGGDVYYVTNLNSTGAGSLYNGITTVPSAGRTIIFNVSGPIHLAGGIATRITQNKITIAGQTAPGDGILLKDGTLRISADDIVIRHLRFRHGKYGSGGDCIDLDSNSINTMLDHIAMSFSTDENISSYGSPPENLTMQWSFNAWGLESHSAGGLWDQNHATCHHSVWAHNHTRNAKARPSGLLEWTNNVTFDWDIGFIMGDSQTPATWKANVIGNYFVCPPGNIISKPLIGASLDRNGYPNFSVWQTNNLHDNNGDGILNGTDRGWNIVNGSAYNATTNPTGNYIALASAVAGSTLLNIESPRLAYKKIVSNAGPLRMDGNYTGTLRDEVDTRLMQNLTTQTRNHITRETDLAGVSGSGFGTFNSTPPPADSDLDGMPNYWETSLGWNVATDDHNTVFASLTNTFFPTGTPLGYTYLEEYLHYKSVPHALVAKNTIAAPSSFTVDLRKYTAGFTSAPTFAISALSGGTIIQYAANGTTISATGPIVKFTPTIDTFGRGKFIFTVIDSEGDSWSQQFCLLVSAAALPKDLSWLGDSSINNWDTTSNNWKKTNGQTTTFALGDNVLIDDSGSNTPAINLTAAQAPGEVTITGNKNYTISGSGSLAASGALTKASDSTLTISSPTSFAGGTFFNGGETIISQGASIGGGPMRFTQDSTLRSNYNATTTHGFSPAMQVDDGAAASIYLPQKYSVNGSLSGAGTFNIYSPSTAPWGQGLINSSGTGCTGTVNLIGQSGGRFGFVINGGSFTGFPSAKVNLTGAKVQTRNNSGGNTFTLGSLSGDSTSILSGSYYAGAATWSVGGNNQSTTFAGSISNGDSGAGTGFIKTGSGTLTLSGTNTHTGATAVNGGTLRVTGSLGATAVSVANGATFAAATNIGSSLLLSGGSYVDVGAAPQTVGTLTVANGLTLASGCNLRYDLSSSPSGANDKISVTAGTLSQSGTINFLFNLKDGYLSAGTYNLVTDAPTSSASTPVFTHNLPAAGTTRQTFAFGRSSTGATGAKSIWLTVTGAAGNLVWTGTTSTWDIATSTPWTGSALFYNLDAVTFDSTASNRIVTLTGSLEPSTITVNHTGVDYNFQGAGNITGNSRLIKSGTGNLIIGNTLANTFSGGTTINAGTVSIAAGSAGLLGTGNITLSGGTLALPNSSTFLSNNIVVTSSSAISSAYSGNSTVVNSTASTLSGTGILSLNTNGIISINGKMDGFGGTISFGSYSGMLRLNSNTSVSSDVNFGSAAAHFSLGTGSATVCNRNGDNTFYFGAISGGPNTHVNGKQTSSADTNSTYIVGGLNTSTTFSGSFGEGGDLGGLNIIKVGSGVWTLAGTSDFVGSFTVQGGGITVTGNTATTASCSVDAGAALNLTNGTLTCESVNNSGTFTAYGTLNGDLFNNGITVGRGYSTGSIGTLTMTGSATFLNGSTLRMKGGTASDKIIVNGDLDLSSTVQIALTSGTTFGRFPLITYTGSLTSFSPTLTGIPVGTTAKISNSVAGSIDLVINDNDEDGLPDSWETTYFGNLNQTPTGDYDGDGTSNLAEYRLNLLPNNGTQFFKATGVKNANNFILSWPFAAGIVFTVQRSQTLNNDWITLSTVTGAGTYTDPSPPAVKAFYRVQFTP